MNTTQTNTISLEQLSNDYVEVSSGLGLSSVMSCDFCIWLECKNYLINGINPTEFWESNVTMDNDMIWGFVYETEIEKIITTK